jgi:multiple sugar transport system permease protein
MFRGLSGFVNKKTRYYYLLLVPSIVLFLLINIYPLLYSIFISFTSYSLSRPFDPVRFVQVENYRRLFTDPMFLQAFVRTFIYVTVAVSIEFLFGLLIALALNKEGTFGRILLTVFLMPIMLTPIIIGLMWRFMFNYDVGLVNYFLTIIGLDRFPFLAHNVISMFAVITVDVWQWTPYILLFIYSGLQSLPLEFFEAARIDGAASHQIFWYITLPSLKNTIFISLLIRGMDAIREYDKIFTMTYGGPGTHTETISFYIYRQGFKIFDTSYASAASLILLIVTIVVTQFVVNRYRKGI